MKMSILLILLSTLIFTGCRTQLDDQIAPVGYRVESNGTDVDIIYTNENGDLQQISNYNFSLHDDRWEIGFDTLSPGDFVELKAIVNSGSYAYVTIWGYGDIPTLAYCQGEESVWVSCILQEIVPSIVPISYCVLGTGIVTIEYFDENGDRQEVSNYNLDDNSNRWDCPIFNVASGTELRLRGPIYIDAETRIYIDNELVTYSIGKNGYSYYVVP